MNKILASHEDSSLSINSLRSTMDTFFKTSIFQIPLIYILLIFLNTNSTYAQQCNCEDYIYINDPASNGAVHKFKIENDSTLTEIFSDNANMTPFVDFNVIIYPHGVTTDNLGNVFIGNIDRGATATRGIDKYDFAANLKEANAIPNDEDPANTNGPGGTSLPNGPIGSQTNIKIINDVMYVNSWVQDDIDGPRLTAYDICSGEQLGYYEARDSNTGNLLVTGNHWGVYIDEDTKTAYYNTSQGIVVYDLTLPYGSQDSIIIKTGPSSSNNRGITRLPDGTFITRDNNNLFKYAADGTYINSVDMSTVVADEGLGEGGSNSWGLIYNPTNEVLYVASSGKECASVYDEDLNYVKAAFVVPGGSSEDSKAIAITRECCPINSITTIDTILCGTLDAPLFLSNLVACEGGLGTTGDPTEDPNNTNLSFDPCSGKIDVIDPNQSACGTFTLSNDGNGDANQCNAYTIQVNVTVAPQPAAKVFAIQASCTDGVPNNDGYLQISEITSGVRFNWSLGNTYVGDPDFADAIDTTGLSFPHQFLTGQANPSGSQDYTIRIFSEETSCGDHCYRDYIVTMQEQDCTSGCACTEYIYLNEPTSGAIHKFKVNTDSSLTEIGAPWYSGTELASPHGLTTDLNGNVYVGEHYLSGNDIRKLDCDGNILAESEFAISTNGQFNLASEGNTLYRNGTGSTIYAYDLCTQSQIGEVTFCDLSGGWNNWGFSYNSTTKLFYVSSGFLSTNPKRIWVFSADDFDNDPTTCVSSISIDVPLPAGDVRGIVSDNDENIFVAVQTESGTNCSYIMKYDKNGVYQGQSDKDCVEDGAGWRKIIGLVYSETTNLIYSSTESQIDDCVYVFDTNLNDIGSAVGPVPSGSDNSKGIAIIKECCPTSTNVTIDTTICAASIGDKFFLQELINCDGSICEGIWDTLTSNVGMSLDSCDNSVVIYEPGGCGTFILESNGTGNNPQCGAFTITVNVCTNCYDWGDLPDIAAGTNALDYETDSINNGPSHILVGGLFLGNQVDEEDNGQSSANALGDGVDEDALSYPATMQITAESTLNIPFSATNTSGSIAHVEMWIDWNGDGDFDEADEMVVNIDDSSGFPNHLPISIPSTAIVNQSIGVRIRLSNTDDMTPYGAINSGEVEDYLIQINCGAEKCLTISNQINRE